MASTDPDLSRRSTAAPHPRSIQRPAQLDIFSTSADDVQNPLPSPPYRREPTSATAFLSPYTEDSPAYRSRSAVDLDTETSPMVDRKDVVDLGHESDMDEQPKSTTKTARFMDDQPSPGHSAPVFIRTDSGFDSVPRSGSRSPSIADTDDDDDDYDWSGEEDLVDEEAKFEQTMGTAKKNSWGFKRFLGLLFGSLVGSTLLSGIIIAPALLIHFYWYKPHPDEHRRYVKDNVEAWLFWAGANLTISWYLALIIDIIPIVARYLIAMVWGHISEEFKSKLELYNSVKNTIKPVFYAASAWASWVIIFTQIYKLYDMNNPDESRAQYTTRIYDVVEFVFFLALVICLQKMLLHAIAFAFHRTAYRERLNDLQTALRAVEKLRAYRPKRSHIKSQSQGFGSRSLNALNLGIHLSRPGTPAHSRGGSLAVTPIESRPVTPSPLERELHPGTDDEGDATLVNRKGKAKDRRSAFFGRPSPDRAETDPQPRRESSPHSYPPNKHGRKESEDDESLDVNVKQAAKTVAKTVKTAVLHDARNIQGKDASDLGGLVWDVSSSHEAKRLAKAIFAAFKSGTRNYLIPSDFYAAFPTKEDAEAAFRVFDKDNNGDLSRAEIKTTLLKVYKERRLLSRSMRDVGVALQSLDQILLFFALVILFFISLSIFGVSVGNSLTSLYSLGIGLSFIFKNAASNAFDAIMFLFVTHPFDTGDRCFIDDENLVVKKMNLFATVFTRSDGTESYYFNSQLFNKFITNARRSGKTAENCVIQVHWKTPLEKLDALEECMNNWLATEKNRWFEPSTGVTLQHIKYMRHLEITLGIGHNGNWQDWGMRNARRTAFNAAVNYYCRQLGITAYEAPLPVHYADADTQDLMQPEDGYMDDDYDNDAQSTQGLQPPADGQPQIEVHRPMTLGFQPPPDKPMPGIRARKSKSKKALLRAVGADG